jgi:hypothetical protein
VVAESHSLVQIDTAPIQNGSAALQGHVLICTSSVEVLDELTPGDSVSAVGSRATTPTAHMSENFSQTREELDDVIFQDAGSAPESTASTTSEQFVYQPSARLTASTSPVTVVRRSNRLHTSIGTALSFFGLS